MEIVNLLHHSPFEHPIISYAGSEAHIHVYEQGGIAQLGGVHSRVVTNQPDGTLPLPAIEALIRGRDDHFPITRLICLETTQNRYDDKSSCDSKF